MEQRRREQEHHEKQQELQQLKHKDKSQQSESIHTHSLTRYYKFQFRFEVVILFSFLIGASEESPCKRSYSSLLYSVPALSKLFALKRELNITLQEERQQWS